MKRRTAIISMISASIGVTAASYIGWNYKKVTKEVNLKDLSNYKDMLADLVNLIIPETDSPGAKEVGVHHYVILMINDAKGRKEQNNLINGLADFRDYCNDNYNTVYEKCSDSDKIKVLNYFEEQGVQTGIMAKIRTKIFGKSFFRLLKELTIEGYCTSEVGATQLLAYEYVPGRYNAVVTMNKNTKTWATK